MSEYQYYEFQAVDRPLTETEMAELRSYSTRARIMPASFINDYSPRPAPSSAPRPLSHPDAQGQS